MSNKNKKGKFKNGIVTYCDHDGIEITEQSKDWKPKKTTWWFECEKPLDNMPYGTRVSYMEGKNKNGKYKLIHSVLKRYED